MDKLLPWSGMLVDSIASWETHIHKIVDNDDNMVALVFTECDVRALDDIVSVEVVAPIGYELKLDSTHTCHFTLVSDAALRTTMDAVPPVSDKEKESGEKRQIRYGTASIRTTAAQHGSYTPPVVPPAKRAFSGKISLLFEFQMRRRATHAVLLEKKDESILIDIPIEQMTQVRGDADGCRFRAVRGTASVIHFVYHGTGNSGGVCHPHAVSDEQQRTNDSLSAALDECVIEMRRSVSDGDSLDQDPSTLESIMTMRCATDCSQEMAADALRRNGGVVVDAIKALTHQSGKPCTHT